MIEKKRSKLIYVITPLLFMILNFCIFTQNTVDYTVLNIKDIFKTELIHSNDASSNYFNKNRLINNIQSAGLFGGKAVAIKDLTSVSVYPGGVSLGVKLSTKGVLVVALSDIDSKNDKISSPAAGVGIIIGDSLISINGKEIENAEMLTNEINNFNGEEIELMVERKGEKFSKKIKPQLSNEDKKYKLGLWVRDSTAGVGTLTFYDDKTNRFAALGHPVTDIDTGDILNINDGEVVESSIVSIRKGAKGSPGELKGIFLNEESAVGTVTKNTECGIFGDANNKIVKDMKKEYMKPMKIANKKEIQLGKAQIITTVDEQGPKEYDIEIVKLLDQEKPNSKSMVIKVTDSRLLEKTGGIVQGMSGSPIIQNNKIIGAVTHVLINKPDTGYGIYIEWMIQDSEILLKQE